MFKKYKGILILIVLIFGGFLLFKNKAPKVVDVRNVALEKTTVRKTVSASGVTKSQNEADLSFASTGVLQYLNVEKGQKIEKGEYIGNVYNYDLDQSSKALKDSRDVAIRDLDIYKKNYQNDKDKVGGEIEYDLNIRRLQELVDKSEAAYQSSLGTLSKSYLYAPFSGTVVDVFYDYGELIAIGSPVIKLADLDNLEFEISVDQEDFGNLRQDQPVEIVLDSYDGHTFTGNISDLPQYADSSSEEFTVEISVKQDTDFPVLLGMKGDATVIIEEKKEVNALSFDSVFSEGSEFYVWENVNGSLKKVNINIGLEGDIYTEILTDLDGHNLVIPESNGIELEDGLKIKVLEE